MNGTPHVAGLPRRIATYFVDVVVLAVAVQASQWALYAVAPGVFPSSTDGPAIEAWVLLTVSAPVWLYFSLSEWRTGQTLGKRLLGLRVTNSVGGRVLLRQAVIRTILKLLPWDLTHLTLLLPVPIYAQPGFRFGFVVVYALMGLYLVVMLLNRRKQGVHDLMAGTIVSHTTQKLQEGHLS